MLGTSVRGGGAQPLWYRTRGVIVSFFYFSGRKIYTRIEAAPLIEAAEAKIRNRNTIEAAAYTRHNTVFSDFPHTFFLQLPFIGHFLKFQASNQKSDHILCR